ncbi:hypothetical protein HNP55_001384 [Paucibacter oligotrophus]|uniref:Lipoprotein n=1 Tax=Roseateles oligotrophus TaxID=1769250 RepID=A0A840L9R9_9BURK|nr:hypothetical protein [Roseateles oligotrophus]MBB4842869.1 hypothetical protein [Roseateles oligotrophus]
MKTAACRSALPLLALLSLLTLGGCGTPADAPGMRLDAAETLQLRSWVPQGLKAQVLLASVSGGQPTGMFWGSKISNPALREAVDESLRGLGLVPSAPGTAGTGRYRLNVKLVEIEQPMVGLDIKVAVTLEYSLLDTESEDRVAYQRRLRTLHTANFSEAMLDPNARTRIASEAAVRKSVNAMVREWMVMSWH